MLSHYSHTSLSGHYYLGHYQDSSFMKKDSNLWELIKFLITGVICAAADLLTTSLFLLICKDIPYETLKSAIALLAGFLVGVTLNYILSTFWVFKGKQDSRVTKSAKFIIIFIICSAIAYGLSLGTYELCRIAVFNGTGRNINEIGINYIIKFTFWDNPTFWFYFLAFFLKTFVGLVWNYFTRKYILYKRK